jgi:hypothetical protein
MRKLGWANALLAAILMLLGTIAAQAACPAVAESSVVLNYKAERLFSPVTRDIVAGGGNSLGDCADVPGFGYVIEMPDISMNFKATPDYELELRTTGACDTVLLVNDGTGNWLYSDDDGGEGNALIRIAAPTTGRYDIWVGTYRSSTCDTQLVFETF